MEVKERSLASPRNTMPDSPPTPLSSSEPSQTMNVPPSTNLGSIVEATTTPAMAQIILTMSAPAGIVEGRPGSSGDSSRKKKRGRPRKYDADGNLSSAYLRRQRVQVSPPPGFSMSPTSPSEFSAKKGRGRPPGSGHWQVLASFGEFFVNTACTDFTPHVVFVDPGQDVAGKIFSLAQKGKRGICILSAVGTISSVTIRTPGSPNGMLRTYEGRFEILSLSGSFTEIDNGDMRSETGGLCVSLAGPDGRVVGGSIAGLLIAAGPVQAVVGSFTPNDRKLHKRKYTHPEQTVISSIEAAPETVHAIANGENTVQPSPQAQEQGPTNGDDIIVKKQNVGITSNNVICDDSSIVSEQRESPDINVSLNSE